MFARLAQVEGLKLGVAGVEPEVGCRDLVPSAMMVARLIRFSISRTLPGQAWAEAPSASAVKPRRLRPSSRRSVQEGLRQQHGVAGRSRSGGISP
jgi:hypothetical protein